MVLCKYFKDKTARDGKLAIQRNGTDQGAFHISVHIAVSNSNIYCCNFQGVFQGGSFHVPLAPSHKL